MGIIYLGEHNKESIINNYIQKNNIKKIYIIGNEIDNVKFDEIVSLNNSINYSVFYKYLQDINDDCLVVLNEILRLKSRSSLQYNCVRRYVLQTKHRLIFNYYPVIDDREDFMILYDMIQSNPFLKQSFMEIIEFKDIILGNVNLNIQKSDVFFDDKIIELYENKKEEIFSNPPKSPNLIPKQLLRFSESIHKKYTKSFDSMGQLKPNMNILVSQLKVDQYYYKNLLKIKSEVEYVISRIQRDQCS